MELESYCEKETCQSIDYLMQPRSRLNLYISLDFFVFVFVFTLVIDLLSL